MDLCYPHVMLGCFDWGMSRHRDGGRGEMREERLVRLAMRSGVCFRGDVVLSMGCQSLNYVVHVVKDALEGVAMDRDPNDMRMRRKMTLHQSVQLD